MSKLQILMVDIDENSKTNTSSAFKKKNFDIFKYSIFPSKKIYRFFLSEIVELFEKFLELISRERDFSFSDFFIKQFSCG